MILKGTAVSPGVVLGKVYVYKAFDADVQEAYFEPGNEGLHRKKLVTAVASAKKELDEIIASFGNGENADNGEIFVAHKEILNDEALLEMVVHAVIALRQMPDFAITEVFKDYIELLSSNKSSLMAARADDFKDVRNRVIRALHSEKERNLSNMGEPVIVVARDLLPGDTATLDRKNVLGIITEVGSGTSHSAIIANSYQIPAVLGVCDCTSLLQNGSLIGLDAILGEVIINPNAAQVEVLRRKQRAYEQQLELEAEYATKPFCTADGVRLEMGINVTLREVENSYNNSDFIGLLRTEFLYMGKDSLPTEEEQYIVYKTVLKNAAGKIVTLRTLDIGGDKNIDYLQIKREENPALGKRAIRFCLDNLSLFKTQLRAALRASVQGDLWVMLPMVGSMDDIRRARLVFEEVKNELKHSGVPYSNSVKFGVMVEVPSIATIADIVAKEVDFASVGTNDLCQYLCAADRMNPDLGEYYQPLSPAMVRTLAFVADAFNGQGKSISVCGELAGSTSGALLLVGLGYKKLSMAESKQAKVKAKLVRYTMPQIKKIAKEAQSMDNEQDIKYLLK